MVQSDNRFLFEIGKTPECSQCSLLGLLLLPCGILRNPDSNKLWLNTEYNLIPGSESLSGSASARLRKDSGYAFCYADTHTSFLC